MQRTFPLSLHFRLAFGQRVQKIPLDAGASCPNRDGTLSSTGCAFCNERGSGSGLLSQGMRLSEQWEHWRKRLSKRYKATLFMAYLQSFSNTYGPASRLRETLEQLKNLTGLAGLSIGTRPDCLDAEKLDLLSEFPAQETWLELGLQSCNDTTLQRVNRGHTAEDFAVATKQAANLGLNICAHVIFGLPGEGPEDWLCTVRFVAALPIKGIKFHNLYVCDKTAIGSLWKKGEYTPVTREDYVTTLCRSIELLPPSIVIHRLTGDAAPGELLAPDWAADKSGLLNAINAGLEARDIWQGKALGVDRDHWEQLTEKAFNRDSRRDKRA